MYNIFKLPFICLFLVAAIGVGLPTSTANAQVGEKIPPDSSTYGLLEPDSQLDWVTSSVAEDNDNSDNNDHSEEQDSQFIAEFKNFLNEDLDIRDDSNLPTTSTDMIIVGTANEAEVKIGLPTEAQLDSTGNLRGHSEVIYESDQDLHVEVATISGNGIRMITVIDGPHAPTTYTYPLDLPRGVKLLIADGVGNALLAANGADGYKL